MMEELLRDSVVSFLKVLGFQVNVYGEDTKWFSCLCSREHEFSSGFCWTSYSMIQWSLFWKTCVVKCILMVELLRDSVDFVLEDMDSKKAYGENTPWRNGLCSWALEFLGGFSWRSSTVLSWSSYSLTQWSLFQRARILKRYYCWWINHDN